MTDGRLSPTRLVLALVALAAVAMLVLVTVGGGGSSNAAPEHASGPGSSDQIVPSDDEVTKTGDSTEIETGQFPSGHDTDEESASGTPPLRPCELVSKVEATAILGRDVVRAERPLGPTCVISGSGREVSLAITEAPMNALVGSARKVEKVTVSGRAAYCLRHEASSLVIDLGHDKILQVTGPCQAGVRFAAAALPRISAQS
jgi:hypothetical protein